MNDGRIIQPPPLVGGEPELEHEHKAPLIIDTRFLRPLPKPMWQATCVNCDKRQSMWEMGPPSEPNPVCSLCFLYESQWAEKRKDEVHAMVRDVEAYSGDKFLRDRDNVTLLSPKDGDRILGALALTSRMFQLQDKMEAVKEREGSDDVADENAKRAGGNNEAGSGD